MVNKEQYIKWLVNAIAGKLIAHGVSPENYSKDHATLILQNCVAPTQLIDCLDKHELEVKDIIRLAGNEIKSLCPTCRDAKEAGEYCSNSFHL